MIYDAHNRAITTEENNNADAALSAIAAYSLGNQSAPQNVEPFNKLLKREFGEVKSGFPLYRFVWGQDTTNTVFAMGGRRMKYPMIVDHYQNVAKYVIQDVVNNKYHVMPVKQFDELYGDSEQLPKGMIVIPVLDKGIKITGVPHWYCEVYHSRDYYGKKSDWEAVRLQSIEELRGIDAIGPYPKDGRYEQFFEVYEYDDYGTKKYRPLADDVVDELRWRHRYVEETRQRRVEDLIKESKQHREDVREKQIEEVFDGSDKEIEAILVDRKHFA